MIIEYNQGWKYTIKYSEAYFLRSNQSIASYISWNIFVLFVVSTISVGGRIAPLVNAIGIIIIHFHARVSDDVIEIYEQLEMKYVHSLDFLTLWIYLYIFWFVLIDKLDT